MVRWLKKSSNETCFTWSHMHEKSRWLSLKMAKNLDHVSFYWDGSFFRKKSRWLKKSSNETCLTWSHMHLILKWLKIRTIHFSLIFSSKYWSRVFWPKWLTFFSSKMLKWLKIRIIFASNSISLRILSHFNIFELKKVSHFGQKTCDLDFEEGKREKWIVRILSHFKIKCKC